MVTEEKLSLPEAARRLSLPPSTLATWVKTYKAGRLGEELVISGPTLKRVLDDHLTATRRAPVGGDEGTGLVAEGVGLTKSLNIKY